jgi:hypothetical protein
MTTDDSAQPATTVPAPRGVPATIRRVAGSVKRFWSDRESPLPQPVRWWRAM